MITAEFVRGCKPRAKMYEVTCDALPGFILRVLPSGKKIALVRFRVDGKDRRERIGQLGPALSISTARRKAAMMLVQRGSACEQPVDDDAEDQPPARTIRTPTSRHAAPTRGSTSPEAAPFPRTPVSSRTVTVRELAERFVRVHVDVHLKPGTAERYRQQLATVILPALGDRDFRTVTRADVVELHSAMKDRPAAANNMAMVVASLYSRIIEDWELADMRNPAHKIRLFPMRKRERFLTPEERQRLHAVIQAGLAVPEGRRGHLKLQSVWALDLLALTGRRRDEILTLTWPMVDWQHSLLNLPDTKTGQLRTPVSARVLALLRHIHDQSGRPSTGYVLRTDRGTRLTGLNHTWSTIRKAADLMDVRLHDLRHSFASDALMSGIPLAVVGELLGHKHARTTQRYAHLANHVVREALEVATSRIVDAVKPIAPLPPAFQPLTDVQWKAIAAIVESTRGACGGPRTDLRRAVDGIRWVLHAGVRWRELPAEFGAVTTCWRWYQRWCSDRTWEQIVAILNLPPTQAGREPGHRP